MTARISALTASRTVSAGISSDSAKQAREPASDDGGDGNSQAFEAGGRGHEASFRFRRLEAENYSDGERRRNLDTAL